MRCRTARMKAVAGCRSDISFAAARHLEACDSCRAWRERDERLARLLAWKRHEQPSLYLETSLRARVREAIAAGQGAPGVRWAEWFPTLGQPLGRFALAAIFIGMIAFQFLADPPSSVPARPVIERSAVSYGGFAPAPGAAYRMHPEAARIAVVPPLPAWAEQTSLSIPNYGPSEFSNGVFYRRVSLGEP